MMRFPTTTLILFACVLGRASGETPAGRDSRMEWWREARFGMFVHWGIYSGLAATWQGEEVKAKGGPSVRIQQRAKQGIDTYTYAAAAIPVFRPKEGFARQWARVAKQAGCKYVVFTTKHHDGFALHDSALTQFDAGDVVGRDLVKEIVEALRAEGLRVGFYHSLIDWHHPQYDFTKGNGLPYPGGAKAVAVTPRDHDKYLDFLHGQARELATRYGPIDIFWWDYSFPGADGEFWRATDLMELVRKSQPQVIMNNRLYRRPEAGWAVSGGASRQLDTQFGDFTTPERSTYDSKVPGLDWESCITMNESWGFNAHDHAWKSSKELIRLLVDTASKGGNLLLNVGPTGEGEIPQESVERMADIGNWMARYGNSIHGTTAGPLASTPWGRCTARRLENDNTRLYLHVFDWPTNGRLTLTGLANEVISAELVGEPEEMLSVERASDGLLLKLPAKAPDTAVSVIALDLRGRVGAD